MKRNPFAWIPVVACLFIAIDTQAQLPKQEIDVTADVPAFSLFDKAFYANQLFLLGESHGYQKPQAVDLALLKHLNQRVGVRYYIAEVDPTKAYYLNQYLNTGNDSILMQVFRSWIAGKAQWANRDFYRKLQAIRTYNQTLPANRRIRFVGIDAVQDRALVGTQLTELTTYRPGRELLYRDSLITLLRAKPRRPDSLVAVVAQQWLDALSQPSVPGRYARRQRLAETKSVGLPDTLAELTATLKTLTYWKTIKSREKTLFANFRDAVDRLKLHTEKLYGFWGLFHVLQATPEKTGIPFAAMVNESDLPMKGKVVSLVCRYVDSYMMVPSEFLPPFWQEKGKAYSRVGQFNDNGEMMRLEGIDTLIEQSRPSTCTLFKLPGTSMGQQPIKMTYSPVMPPNQQLTFDPKRPATNYYQYVVLIRNSEMTEGF